MAATAAAQARAVRALRTLLRAAGATGPLDEDGMFLGDTRMAGAWEVDPETDHVDRHLDHSGQDITT